MIVADYEALTSSAPFSVLFFFQRHSSWFDTNRAAALHSCETRGAYCPSSGARRGPHRMKSPDIFGTLISGTGCLPGVSKCSPTPESYGLRHSCVLHVRGIFPSALTHVLQSYNSRRWATVISK